MRKGFIIAIDGPVAAGKGTLAPILAQKLNGFYLYTGAMYRCLSLICSQENVDMNNETEVIKLLPQIKISFKKDKVILNDKDVTNLLKNQEIANGSSKVATISTVRKIMVQKQQQIAQEYIAQGEIVIAEGRDTATAAFPEAALKIYLTAQSEIRAQRRLKQLQEMGDNTRDFQTILKEVKLRDKQDQERKTDPLVKEPEKFGYFTVDDSNLTKEQTVEIILTELKRKALIQ